MLMRKYILILITVFAGSVKAEVTVSAFDVDLRIPDSYHIVPIPSSKDIYLKLLKTNEQNHLVSSVYFSTGDFCNEEVSRRLFVRIKEDIFIEDVRDFAKGNEFAKRIFSCSNEILLIGSEELFRIWRKDLETGAKYWADLNTDIW